MKILLAYGSAMARLDDMKLLGGVSGGRTGREVLDSLYPLADEWQVRVLTNPWLPVHNPWGDTLEPGQLERHTFRTWEEYRDLLYAQCEEWQPDIVICAPAVANFTPSWMVQTTTDKMSRPVPAAPCVEGKIDTRRFNELLVCFEKTPSIIGGVRERIGRDAVLVGFKLTSVGDVDMTTHAEEVLYEAKCDFVVANDLQLGLGRKFFVTPTGWVERKACDIIDRAEAIRDQKQSGFYKSVRGSKRVDDEGGPEPTDPAWPLAQGLWGRLEQHWTQAHGGILHGCFAVRCKTDGFLTTSRGKTADNDQAVLTRVLRVNHEERWVLHHYHKATLNAPLLSRLFETHPRVNVIVHLHRLARSAYSNVPYVVPGTAMEADLADKAMTPTAHVLDPVVLNIEGHGSLVGFRTTDVDEIMAWVEHEPNWQEPKVRTFECSTCGDELVTMEDCERHVRMGCR